MTSSHPGTHGGEIDSPGAGSAPPAVDGLRDTDVQELYDAVARLVDKQLHALRRLQADAEGRLRLTIVEQQQLHRFLDEVDYRLRFLTEAPDAPTTSTLRAAVQTQHVELQARQSELRRAQTRLEQLCSRIGWLVRQIEMSAQRIHEQAGETDETDPWALLLRAQLIQGQEAERSRLAREIHDGPAQALTNTLLRLQFVESVIAHRPDEAAREMVVLRTSVRESLRDVRRFIFNLRPASLKDVGLVGTLQRVIGEYREHAGLEVEVTLPESMNLSEEQELVAFRVVQEALHNIQKHAAASRVDVEIAREPDGWIFRITDDGRGFEPSEVGEQPESGSGLVGIRERAAIIGGRLQIGSTPGQGTRVTLTIPDASAAAPAASHSTAPEPAARAAAAVITSGG
ncbi:MAG TPA: sensor histidine kinase [Chloroflexia bacterium]|nr:sensor histidine kinase [Chloroflexia bacterium]